MGSSTAPAATPTSAGRTAKASATNSGWRSPRSFPTGTCGIGGSRVFCQAFVFLCWDTRGEGAGSLPIPRGNVAAEGDMTPSADSCLRPCASYFHPFLRPPLVSLRPALSPLLPSLSQGVLSRVLVVWRELPPRGLLLVRPDPHPRGPHPKHVEPHLRQQQERAVRLHGGLPRPVPQGAVLPAQPVDPARRVEWADARATQPLGGEQLSRGRGGGDGTGRVVVAAVGAKRRSGGEPSRLSGCPSNFFVLVRCFDDGPEVHGQ